MADYDHIEIQREDAVRHYKFQPNRNAPRPPSRDRNIHGSKLKNELEQTVLDIETKRLNLGIQSENLLVLEILSDAMSPDVLENMLRKFNLYLVEETPVIDTNNSKLVIQFDNRASLNAFNYERELWEKDEQEEAILTYAQRRNLFNCIENIRTVTRTDRIGNRLKKCFDNVIPFPEGFFIVNIDVWFNGDRSTIIEVESQIKRVLGTQGSFLLGDLYS
ncbi:MAG: hypothetical protein PHU66_06025 [Bacteroidaceae bacterium]|nr:hypothetical protein [Bacteroidaceae bacterium]